MWCWNPIRCRGPLERRPTLLELNEGLVVLHEEWHHTTAQKDPVSTGYVARHVAMRDAQEHLDCDVFHERPILGGIRVYHNRRGSARHGNKLRGVKRIDRRCQSCMA
jgi:hypothetical protein